MKSKRPMLIAIFALLILAVLVNALGESGLIHAGKEGLTSLSFADYLPLYSLAFGGLIMYLSPPKVRFWLFLALLISFLSYAAVLLLNEQFSFGIVISPAVEQAFFVLRWVLLGFIVFYGFVKRTLTFWIMVALLLGISIGHDYPFFGQSLQIFSQICINAFDEPFSQIDLHY